MLVGDTVVDDAAWLYPDPLPEAPQLAGHLCFLADGVDTFVDGKSVIPMDYAMNLTVRVTRESLRWRLETANRLWNTLAPFSELGIRRHRTRAQRSTLVGRSPSRTERRVGCAM
ncbi:MAG: hypothetical protein DLM58_08010 [Pseudonocardiales bacterium]|nr:MAG: hypothetical protein DLM58_08010 [Pseudonocardiales bacterium]